MGIGGLGEQRRVLVVDDYRSLTHAIGRRVTSLGCVVRCAYDGREALAIADRFQPELVLLDLLLPDLSGYEVARLLRAQHPAHAPMIVSITASDAASARVLAYAAGFDDHLVKPFEIERVERMLGRLAERT